MAGSERISYPEMKEHGDFFSTYRKSLKQGRVTLLGGDEAIVSSIDYHPGTGTVKAILRKCQDGRKVEVIGKAVPGSPRGIVYAGGKVLVPGVYLFVTMSSGVT